MEAKEKQLIKERFKRAEGHMRQLKEEIDTMEICGLWLSVCEEKLTALSCCVDAMLDQVTHERYK